MNKDLLKEIQRTTPVYDPLVVYVNEHLLIAQCFLGGIMRYGTVGTQGRDFGPDIKVLYEREGQLNINYPTIHKYCVLGPITKHTIIEPKQKTKK
jgi:hypothetical protein